MSSSEESAVREAQRRVWEAVNRGDVKTLEPLLAEDFLLVEAEVLERKDKAAFLRAIAERAVDERPVSFELREVRVQSFPAVAIAYAHFHCQDEVEGERLNMVGNAVDVFVHQGGVWLWKGAVQGEAVSYEE